VISVAVRSDAVRGLAIQPIDFPPFETQEAPMAHSHDSRIFASGTATTLFVTIPAQVVSDSQFPFRADDAVTVTIEDDRLVITPSEDESD
jgi:virulence-associated protein VagC